MNKDKSADIENKKVEIRNMHIDRDEIGKRIKYVREEILNMTQADFFKLINPDREIPNQQAVSNWEHARRNKYGNIINFPNIEQLCAIATAGGVSLEWLLMGDENETPSPSVTTWRGFCRALYSMRYSMPMKIEINDENALNERRNITCDFSIILSYFNPDYSSNPDSLEDYNPPFINSSAGRNIGYFLTALTVTMNNDSPSFKKYETKILNDALSNTPNTIPENNEWDKFPFAE